MSRPEHAQADLVEAPGEDYDLSEQIGFILRQAVQRHVSLFGEIMGTDLTPTQWAVLSRLYAEGGCSQNLLGRHTSMDAATIKGVVDRLIKRKLVRTERDPDDGRRVIVQLTEAGRDFTRELLPRAETVSKVTLSPLATSQRATLISLLKQLR
ncbi:MarR family transcriptional regulator [Bosea sp. TWI1241]|jgi:DNA-binding MarR family transcriptional regulator|uniref:MarR family winged helix-turn-helix transcriptional regulator n=1 Tax=Bosea sp. TWI1241 TaxID=3148904 RepID=UPI003207CD74